MKNSISLEDLSTYGNHPSKDNGVFVSTLQGKFFISFYLVRISFYLLYLTRWQLHLVQFVNGFTFKTLKSDLVGFVCEMSRSWTKSRCSPDANMSFTSSSFIGSLNKKWVNKKYWHYFQNSNKKNSSSLIGTFQSIRSIWYEKFYFLWLSSKCRKIQDIKLF